MNIELYKYGLSNALDDIENLLVDALNTTDKKKRAQWVSEAYGMVKSVNMLINEKEEESVTKK